MKVERRGRKERGREGRRGKGMKVNGFVPLTEILNTPLFLSYPGRTGERKRSCGQLYNSNKVITTMVIRPLDDPLNLWSPIWLQFRRGAF